MTIAAGCRAGLEQFHLTLLASSPTGYRDLVKLSSAGFMDGFQRGKPTVDIEQVAAHSEGVIGLTGCLQSRLCQQPSCRAVPRERGLTQSNCLSRWGQITSISRSSATASPARIV